MSNSALELYQLRRLENDEQGFVQFSAITPGAFNSFVVGFGLRGDLGGVHFHCKFTPRIKKGDIFAARDLQSAEAGIEKHTPDINGEINYCPVLLGVPCQMYTGHINPEPVYECFMNGDIFGLYEELKKIYKALFEEGKDND